MDDAKKHFPLGTKEIAETSKAYDVDDFTGDDAEKEMFERYLVETRK